MRGYQKKAQEKSEKKEEIRGRGPKNTDIVPQKRRKTEPDCQKHHDNHTAALPKCRNPAGSRQKTAPGREPGAVQSSIVRII